MSNLETEIKSLIVEALMLENIAPSSIESEAPLFGSGLGLDSIDALELAIAIEQRFGVRISTEDSNTRAIFASVSTLAEHIAAHRKS